MSFNAVKNSLSLVKSNFGTVVMGLIISCIIGCCSLGILFPVMLAGYYHVLQKLALGEKGDIGQIFSLGFANFGRNWLAGFIYCLIVGLCIGLGTIHPAIGILGNIFSWFFILFLPTAVDPANQDRGVFSSLKEGLSLFFANLTEVIIMCISINICQFICLELPKYLLGKLNLGLFISLLAILFFAILAMAFQAWRDMAATMVYRASAHPYDFGDETTGMNDNL